MEAEQSAGAASDLPGHWREVDWRSVTGEDRAMQALHLLALNPVAETTADQNSYGFRQKRRCADAVDGCAIALRRPWLLAIDLEGDIRGCFDNISHEWLLAHVPMDRAILRK